MVYANKFLALLAALGIGLTGCNDTTGVDPAYDVEAELEDVEQVDPEADVEVMPSGEVDVQLDPEVAP